MAKTYHPPHVVDKLREICKTGSRRPFIARGANTKRCPSCLMAEFACFCDERKVSSSPIDFVLLFHRDEIHKPTNSGRLIADLFPEQTQAFIWHRNEPEEALLTFLDERKGHCTVLFPRTETAAQQGRIQQFLPLPTASSGQQHTFIVLDGTWKQASKMFHQSTWLKDIPHFEISHQAQRSFLVRHSSHDMQFATAEVVALLLDALGEETHSKMLLNYYQTFNQRCLLSRQRGYTSL